MPLAPNMTCANSHKVNTTTPAVASRRRMPYNAVSRGRMVAILRSAQASACGARPTSVRRLDSGRVRMRILGRRPIRRSIVWPLRSAFPEEVARILFQFPSELLFCIRRQAEVFALKVKGTNFDKLLLIRLTGVPASRRLSGLPFPPARAGCPRDSRQHGGATITEG